MNKDTKNRSEVADSPDMDGPVDSEEPYAKVVALTKHWRVETPRADHYYSNQTDAEETAATTNDAFKAGRSSLTGIDIEQEAQQWLAKRLGFEPYEAHRITSTMADAGMFAAFARFILSIKDGKGGGDASASLPIANAWIPVSEKSPELDTRYLVTNEDQTDVRAAWWTQPHSGECVWTSRKHAGEYWHTDVYTHYATLPSPPSQAPQP